MSMATFCRSDTGKVQCLDTSSDERPFRSSPQADAHTALINQIQTGVKLRKSPLGPKIRKKSVEEAQPRFFPEAPDFSVSSPDSYYDDSSSIVSGTSGASNSSSGSQACSPKLNSPKTSRRIESTMPANKMRQNIANSDLEFDVTQIPGFQPVPDNCPGWKRAMIEKKNSQLVTDTKDKIYAQREEEERWRDVPEWKRKLISEKEKKRGEEMAPIEAERHRQEEEMTRLQLLPEWKRNLIVKKRVGDIN